jgi:hypothetical protein
MKLVQIHHGEEGSECVDKVASFLGSPFGWIILLVVTVCLINAFGKVWGLVVMFVLVIALAIAVGLSERNDPADPTRSPAVTTPVVTTYSPEHKVPTPHNP